MASIGADNATKLLSECNTLMVICNMESHSDYEQQFEFKIWKTAFGSFTLALFCCWTCNMDIDCENAGEWTFAVKTIADRAIGENCRRNCNKNSQSYEWAHLQNQQIRLSVRIHGIRNAVRFLNIKDSCMYFIQSYTLNSVSLFLPLTLQAFKYNHKFCQIVVW